MLPSSPPPCLLPPPPHLPLRPTLITEINCTSQCFGLQNDSKSLISLYAGNKPSQNSSQMSPRPFRIPVKFSQISLSKPCQIITVTSSHTTSSSSFFLLHRPQQNQGRRGGIGREHRAGGTHSEALSPAHARQVFQ